NGDQGGNGNGEPNQPVCGPADQDQVAAVRAAVDDQCDCTGARNHGKYVSCVTRVANRAVRKGDLNGACVRQIVSCAARSACGRDGYVACCRTFVDGTTRCGIRRSEVACKAPPGGSACASEHASCCDACEAGGCAPVGSTTTSSSTTTTGEETTSTTS